MSDGTYAVTQSSSPRVTLYNKLFTKILDSSIWLAPDPQRLVWITLIAAMDEDGNAMFACADNLAARARVTIEQAESAIKAFESPDIKSGDPDNDGRRIERFPGGWHVLNAHKYRAIVTKAISREQTRIRTARWRQNKAVVTQSDAKVTVCDESVTPSEAEAISRSETKSQRRATRLTDESFPWTTTRAEVATKEGLNPERTFAKFCDYWRAIGGQKGCKLDWDATWRNWCRTEADRQPGKKVQSPLPKLKTADEWEEIERARGQDPWTLAK